MGLGVLATLSREVLLARIFGTGSAIEMFRLAFAVPNLLGTSLATVVVAALAPTLARHAPGHLGEATALREALSKVGMVAITLSVLGIVTARWQAGLMAPGYTAMQRTLLTSYVATLWGYFFILAMSFGPRALLSVMGRTWPMASSNLILGGTMALGLVIVMHLPAEAQTTRTLTILALIAATVVLLTHFAALPHQVFRSLIEGGLGGRSRLLTSANAMLFIVLAGHLISAAPRLVDRALATSLDQGTVAALDFSYSIITVPGIAFGSVFVIAALPRLTAALRTGAEQEIGALGSRSVVSVFLAVAAGLFLSIYASAVVGSIYGGGAFDERAVSLTSRILTWHGIALGPMVATIILAQAALAAGMVTAFILVALLRILVKIIAVVWLVDAMGVDGLAASFLAPELASTVAFGVILWRWYVARRTS